MMKRILITFIIVALVLSNIFVPANLYAQDVLGLPQAGSMVKSSEAYQPTIISGVNVYPDDPLQFEFIIHKGDSLLDKNAFEHESTKLIKYFMAALTLEEDQMWVNLSPYEKNRIIPTSFGRTEMGRDLLAQDYLLKQLTASMMYPEDELGQKFWNRVREKALTKFGTTEIPMNTFNKIWIVPEQARLYEHAKGAIVVESHLKVMLEEDYVALANHTGINHVPEDSANADVRSSVSSQVVREVLIPEIEREVNEGKTFSNLRQIYNSVILATWYKQRLKDSLLGKVYADQNKTAGINLDDDQINQRIYEQYVQAFKRGVYDYIKEDYDEASESVIPRRYFSGGVTLDPDIDAQRKTTDYVNEYMEAEFDRAQLVRTKFDAVGLPTVQLKPINSELMDRDILSKLVFLESKQNDQEFEVRQRTAEAIAKIYSQMFERGLIGLSELETRLNHSNYMARQSIMPVVGHAYQEMASNQEVVDLSKLNPRLSDTPDTLLALAEALKGVYVELINQGREVDLTDLKKMATGTRHGATFKGKVKNILGELYGSMHEHGVMNLAELEALMLPGDPELARALVPHLAKIYVAKVNAGDEVTIEKFESFLEFKAIYVRQVAGEAIAEIMAAQVRNKIISLAEFEDRLADDNSQIRNAIPKRLGEIYIDQINNGQAVDLTKLLDALRHADNSTFRGTIVGTLGKIYQAMVIKGWDVDMSALEGLLDDGDSFFTQTVFRSLMNVHVEQVKMGMMKLSKLEEYLRHPNTKFSSIALVALGELYQSMLGDIKIVDLESKLESASLLFGYSTIIGALAQTYIKSVNENEMSVSQLLDKLEQSNVGIQGAAVEALGGLYVQMIQEGSRVDIRSLEKQVDAVNISNRQKVIEVLRQIYVAQAQNNQKVNLDFFEGKLELGDPILRREVADALGDIYAQMVKFNKKLEFNNQAYQFWYANQLFLDSANVNKKVLSHILQLDAKEFQETQQWLDQLRENLSSYFKGSEEVKSRIEDTILPTLFYMELLVPSSSMYLLDQLDRRGIEAVKKFTKILTIDQATDSLLKFLDDYPRAHIVEVFTFIDFLVAFSHFNRLGRVEEITQADSPRPGYLFSLLGEDLKVAFKEDSETNPDDMRLKNMEEVLLEIPEDIHPYILMAALKDNVRFPRRVAALKLGAVKTFKDEVKHALFKAVDDPDGEVVENALASLSRIGGQRTIGRLYSILDRANAYVISFIFDDHGSMVRYREKAEIEGITTQKFTLVEKRTEKNPMIGLIKETIKTIEQRSNARRERKTIDLTKIKDQRLTQFFDFLKEHGLEEHVVVVGGGVRDAYAGKELNDIDINIVVPLTAEDHRELIPTAAVANGEIYNYVLEKLSLVASALGAKVEDFLPPMELDAVMWNGIEIQYTGPIISKNGGAAESEGNQNKFIKRSIVGDNGWLYSSSTGAALLQMAIDYRGRLYGHVESLEDFDQGIVRLTGGKYNLDMGGILRMLRLKHEYDLEIFEYDYNILRDTVQRYIDGEFPLPKIVMKNIVLRQLEKVVEKAQNKEAAMKELGKIGLLRLVKDKLDIDFAQLSDSKGGIDLNPNQINMVLEKENESGLNFPAARSAHVERFRGALGFSPNIINISPAGFTHSN